MKSWKITPKTLGWLIKIWTAHLENLNQYPYCICDTDIAYHAGRIYEIKNFIAELKHLKWRMEQK